MTTETKMKRTRKVIGRTQQVVGGKRVKIEMRPDGIYVRPLWCRKEFKASFSEVAWLAFGQQSFSFS